MIHQINTRARLRVVQTDKTVIYILEYRLLLFRLGPIRFYQWCDVWRVEYKHDAYMTLQRVAGVVLAAHRNSPSRMWARRQRQEVVGCKLRIATNRLRS